MQKFEKTSHQKTDGYYLVDISEALWWELKRKKALNLTEADTSIKPSQTAKSSAIPKSHSDSALFQKQLSIPTTSLDFKQFKLLVHLNKSAENTMTLVNKSDLASTEVAKQYHLAGSIEFPRSEAFADIKKEIEKYLKIISNSIQIFQYLKNFDSGKIAKV